MALSAASAEGSVFLEQLTGGRESSFKCMLGLGFRVMEKKMETTI